MALVVPRWRRSRIVAENANFDLDKNIVYTAVNQ